MTAIKNPPNTKTKRKQTWEPCDDYICIKSASPGYSVGDTYTAYKNKDNHTCLHGDDGYEDLCIMLVSSFKRVD